MCKHLKSKLVDLFVQISNATKSFLPITITVSKTIYSHPGGKFPMGDGKYPR
jgi:hypothetical protein